MNFFHDYLGRDATPSDNDLPASDLPLCVFCDEPITDDEAATEDLDGTWAHDACGLECIAA